MRAGSQGWVTRAAVLTVAIALLGLAALVGLPRIRPQAIGPGAESPRDAGRRPLAVHTGRRAPNLHETARASEPARPIPGFGLRVRLRADWADRLPEEPLVFDVWVFNAGTEAACVVGGLGPAEGFAVYEYQTDTDAWRPFRARNDTDAESSEPGRAPLGPWNGMRGAGWAASDYADLSVPELPQAGSASPLATPGELRIRVRLTSACTGGPDVVSDPIDLRVLGTDEIPSADRAACSILTGARDAGGSIWGTAPEQAAAYDRVIGECPTSGYVPGALYYRAMARRQAESARALVSFAELVRDYSDWMISYLSAQRADDLLDAGVTSPSTDDILREIAATQTDEWSGWWAKARLSGNAPSRAPFSFR